MLISPLCDRRHGMSIRRLFRKAGAKVRIFFGLTNVCEKKSVTLQSKKVESRI